MITINNNQTRQSLRNYIRNIRKNLTKKEHIQSSQRITNYIINDYRIQQAQHIGLFISFDGEIQTYPLIKKLLNIGKTIYLPILYPFKKPKILLFSKYTTSTNLILNHFKIYEPELYLKHVIFNQELDILLIPLVAFDRYGNRLGMGGGFYDHTLKSYSHHSKTLLIGLAHDCQKINNRIPKEEWDVPLPEIITPSFHWKWKKFN
ncbi:5-formyltetrahydrofolate cyclo-ligase [Blochmannia endosymbiont of Polyrhachis (Hedomyrma) turneri]|uniref:5-formyltetrahydrofolate cyclo-ligase n=1 Tax=Blochmannia endosymbiont of Polyrhachis (Hedomyrma) turneri TaxID=1505596 RepID=UPI00061A803E|nr:5-formyltetrahydrofolate cyclo-ligase [Blochmannia endosymbiont of Polyrhachis (Hedomyrma) turneri]AKC59828.1 Uncharacterized protein ygfA [Blochmannia endosymbiont of Polyrhachis (Hedomyrma) turneri]